jgi:hypothetical protein
MAFFAPETGFVWGKVPMEGSVRCTTIGEVHAWWSHWCRPHPKGPVQCVRCVQAVGVACAWCDAGYQKRARYVFPALVQGEVRVFEVGRVQFSMIRQLREEGFVGRVLELRKAWKAKNAEIVILPVGRERVSDEVRIDVEQFVSELGGGQLLLISPPPRTSPPSEEVREVPKGLRLVPR